MVYTRSYIDRAGADLIGKDPFKRKNAIPIIQKWRETHLYVLQVFNEQITSFFKKNGITYDFSSMRIKRMPSIEAKLKNNAHRKMKLGGMQDIGGIRFVFETIGQLDEASHVLDVFTPTGFEKTRCYDYIGNPKESGYRSIHYVYRYKSENKDYDGISIELQARTKREHSWAMAVETASLISQTSLKADIDDNSEWRGFFKLVSALFALEEHKPVHKDFEDYDQERYCTEYFKYKQGKLIEQLNALRVTTNLSFDNAEKGFCVLIINFKDKAVYVSAFPEQDEATATETFNEMERTIKEDEAALMAGIGKIKEIKEAYPSYFLDTQGFMNFLDEFERQCNLQLKKIDKIDYE